MNPEIPPELPTRFLGQPGRPPSQDKTGWRKQYKWRKNSLVRREELPRIKYVPTPRQVVFHSCDAEVVFYGGAAGGGKTVALLMEALMHCMEFPGAHALLMRRTYPELEGSLILKSHELFPKDICQYNELKHRWVIHTPQGDSILEFGFCRTDKDKFSYQSREFTFLGIDEASHFTWSIFSYLLSRARNSVKGRKVRIRLCSNPGNVGHTWLKRYFGITKEKPETIWVPEATEEDPEPIPRCFVPARVQDNKHIMDNDPGYVKRLMLLPQGTRNRLLYGSWDDSEGKFFEDFTAISKYVCKSFEVPRHWRIYRAVDYGFTKPFCCLWFALDPDSRVYVIRELYQSGLRDVEQAALIKKVSNEKVEYTLCDPSMKNKNSSGKSPWENYQSSADLAMVPADNNRVAGWMQVRNLMANMKDGKPGLQIFDTCPNTIREMEDAIKDEDNPDDIDTTISDHAIDTLRYFAASRPDTPDIPVQDPYKHLDEASRREWERYDKAIRALTNQTGQAILADMNRGDDA